MYESRLSCRPSGAHDDTVATGLSQSKSIISIISLHVHLGSDGFDRMLYLRPGAGDPITSERRKKRGFPKPKTNRNHRPLIMGVCISRPARPSRYHAYRDDTGRTPMGTKGVDGVTSSVWVNMVKAPK